MKNTYKTVILLLSVFLSYPLHGAKQIKSFNFKGDPSYNTITSIVQDTSGFMWLGTDNGIFLFDGYSLQPPVPPTVNHRYVNFVHHGQSNLYIGTNEGLYTYDYIHNTCNVCSPLLKSKNIIAYQRSNDYQIVATDKELFLFDRDWNLDLRTSIYKESINNHITCMIVHQDKEILLGTESGLVVIRIDNGGKTEIRTLSKGNKIVRLFIDSRQKLWMCRNEEVVYGELPSPTTRGTLDLEHVAYNHEVISFFEEAGEVWVGTRGRGISIYGYDRNGKATLKETLLIDGTGENELKNTINTIYRDKNSKIWICTLEGLYLYDDSSSFHVIRHSKEEKNAPSSNIISSIFYDENNLWLATSNGINRVEWKDKGKYTFTQFIDRRNANDIMAGNKMQCIIKLQGQVFLVSTKNAVKFFDASKGMFYDDKTLNTTLQRYGMRYVRSAFRDYDNRIWLAFSEGGAGSLSALTGEFVRLDYPGKMKDRHRAICRDNDGDVWLSSDNDGVYRLHLDEKLKTTETKLYPRDHFGGSWITSLYVDRQKRVWAGTSNGLYRYHAEEDRFVRLEFPYSKKSSYIGGIVQDNMENIWAVSLHGLYKINMENLIVYYELNVNQDIVKTWYILGICATPNGEVFVGGVNGLNYFNPTELTVDAYPHHIHLTDVKLLNKQNRPEGRGNLAHEVDRSGKLILSYKDTQFAVWFSSLYYKDPMKIEYAYKLEGIDKDWQYTDAFRNYASYSAVKPGRYTFKIKSTNASGIWIDNVRTIEVEVQQAPWKTWWAYLLYALAAGSIFWLIARIFNLGRKLRSKDALSQWELDYYTHLSYGFKVPLTLIYAPLQYLLKNLDRLTNTDVKQMLNTMSQNAYKLSEQVAKLMQFKRLSVGEYDIQLTEVDILPILRGICALFTEEMAAKAIDFHQQEHIATVVTTVDVTKIEVAVYNLMEDAIRYVKNTGSISVKYAVDSRQHKFLCTIEARRDQPQETPEQMPDTRLLIAADYIKAHREKLLVDHPDKGLTRTYKFSILLGSSHFTAKELKTLDKERPMSILATEKRTAATREKALDVPPQQPLPIIDLYQGDKEIDDFVKHIFQGQFHVRINTVEAAAEQLQTNPPSLIILDVNKEEDYKLQLCKRIKQNRWLATVPIVILSSLTTEQTEQQAYEWGADIYVTKPFNPALLEARIKHLLNVRRAIKDTVRQELITDPQQSLVASDTDRFVATLLSIVEDNLQDDSFNLESLADKMRLSRSTLYRKTQETTGITPSDLIKKRRMKRAAQLLSHTDKTVAEVAASVGYTDQRYFAQSFKKEFGATPKQYAMNQRLKS